MTPPPSGWKPRNGLTAALMALASASRSFSLAWTSLTALPMRLRHADAFLLSIGSSLLSAL